MRMQYRLLVGLLIFFGVIFAWFLLPSRITQRNAARIQPGMTIAEVQAILGSPNIVMSGNRNLGLSTSSRCEYWRSSEAEIAVWFDRVGRVERVEMVAVDPFEGLNVEYFDRFRAFWRQLFR